MKRMVAAALLAGVTIVTMMVRAQERGERPPEGVEYAPEADDNERPERGVARISVINGEVSVRRGDTGDWVSAAINAPLTIEDRIQTGPSSRAEVQFDYANMIRLSRDTEVRIGRLEDGKYLLQLARGTATFRVLRDSSAEVDIETPAVSVRPMRRGIYRITVNDLGETEITVRAGEAEIFTPRGSERLREGRTMVARGTPEDPEHRMIGEIPEDDWDRWNERRDQDLLRSRSYNYISKDIYGAEDLDDYGSWSYDAPYGNVWVPRVADDWAPYRHGRWSWVDYYGWSWVSYDPWGWAPYHYGRWYRGNRGWCWWPGGGIGGRHYWRPGLVAFFGWGGGGIGVGFGRVGWLPLGPHEPYYPWYGRRYYRNGGRFGSNVIVNVNIRNTYRNARVHNGITSIDGNDFRRGRMGSAFRGGDSELGGARLVRGQVPHAPNRDSLRLSDREVRTPQRSSNEGRFFSRQPAHSVNRVSFDEQRRGVEEVARRSFGDQGGRSGDVARGEARGSEVRGGEARGNEARGNERVAEGQGARGDRGGQTADSAVRSGDQGGRVAEQGGRSADQSGWQRFGGPRGVETRETETRGSDSRTSDGSDARGWRRSGETPRGSSLGGASGADSGETRSGGSTRSADQDNGGWRRFGEPIRGQERDPSGLTRRSDMGRSSESRTSRVDRAPERSSEMPRDTEVRRDDRRSADRSSEVRRSEPQRYDTRRFESQRNESPRNSESPRVERQQRQREEPVRVSPPIVRERAPSRQESAPSRRNNEYRDSGGSSRGRSIESFGNRGGGGFSAPSRSPSYSSPRGGDGGGRVSGGGGRSAEGGSRSSGGGGGRSSGGGGGSRGGRNR